MPELPEVEVSRMGISPHLVGETIKTLTFRTPKLRWDIPQELKRLEGQVIRSISRRAKYLLIETDTGNRHCSPWYVWLTARVRRRFPASKTRSCGSQAHQWQRYCVTTIRVALERGYGRRLMRYILYYLALVLSR